MRFLAWLALGPPFVLTVVVPGVLQRASATRCGRVHPDLSAIESALCAYRLREGHWPESLQALVVPDANGYTDLNADTLPLDPWGREYGYRPPRAEDPRAVVSTLGRDGRPGGTGRDADWVRAVGE